MRQFFKVSIYNDGPAANPKAFFFDYAAESSEEARQWGLEVAKALSVPQRNISVYARSLDAELGHRGEVSLGFIEQARRVRFRAVYLKRVAEEVGPLDFIKIPNGRWWFEKAECYMSKDERLKMAAAGIPFEAVDVLPAETVFTEMTRK